MNTPPCDPLTPPGAGDCPQTADASAGAAWWVERPSLEYQHAFDLGAVEVRRQGGAVAILASSAFYARELLKRLHGVEAMLVPLGSWHSSSMDSVHWLGPEVQTICVRTPEAIEPLPQTVVWAEPELEGGLQVMRRISQQLRTEARLYVVVSDWLAAFLPEWQEKSRQPARRPAGFRRARTWLSQAGFEVEEVFGFHGPRSILWGYTAQLMERLGRGDWSDRCQFHMRAEYAVSGWQVLFAPVGITLARKR